MISAPVIGGNPDIEALLGMDPIPDVPIPPEALSRDPEVGRAYAADPLVYHGPFKRATLEALFGAVRDVAAGPSFGALPTLWIHGEHDGLAPLAPTLEAIATCAALDSRSTSTPVRCTRCSTRPTRTRSSPT